MLIEQHVPDAVWESLPTKRLPRWRVLGATLLVAILAFGAYAAAQAGVLAPNVSASTGGGSWTEGSGEFTTVITLDNRGAVPVTIDSIALSPTTWLRLDRVTPADGWGAQPDPPPPSVSPLSLDAFEGMSIQLWFTVTDCSAIDRAGLTITAQATAPMRTTTIDITPSGTSDPGAPSSYSWTGSDPWNVPWPGTYAASACGVPLPPKP